MKRSKWLLVLSTLLLWLSGCGQTQTQTFETVVEEVPTPVPETTPVALSAVHLGQTVVVDGRLGSLYPNQALGFGGGISGDIVAVNIQAGDTVQAGEVLALLDDTELQRAVENARRALVRAQEDKAEAATQRERDMVDAKHALLAARRTLTMTQLQISNTSVEEARIAVERRREAEKDAKQAYDTPLLGDWTPDDEREREYEAWQNAIRERKLAEMRLDDARNAYQNSLLEVKSRQADVTKAERELAVLQEGLAPSYDRAIEDAERELSKAEQDLAHTQLIAPFDALVYAVSIPPQMTVNAGTAVITLIDLERGLYFITENLSEQHVATLRPGQNANVTLRTYPEDIIQGVVEAIVPQAEAQQANDARFTVHIRLTSNALYVLPGMTGRAEIFTQRE